MADIAIPQASLDRLRQAYSQFEQLCTIVAEAMGIPPGQVQQINLPGGAFIVADAPGTEPEQLPPPPAPVPANGVVA